MIPQAYYKTGQRMVALFSGAKYYDEAGNKQLGTFAKKDMLIGVIDSVNINPNRLKALQVGYRIKTSDNNLPEFIRVYQTDLYQQKAYTKSEGDKLLNRTVEVDHDIYKALLRQAVMIDQLKKDGKDVRSLEHLWNVLLRDYTKRQEKIANSTSVRITRGIERIKNSAGYQKLMTAFSVSGAVNPGMGLNLLFGPPRKPQPQLGAFPLIPVAIGAAVGLVAAVVLYNAFKTDYANGEKGWKTSRDLDKDIAEKLTEEQKQRLEKGINEKIDEAYHAGKTDGFFSGSKGIIVLGLGLLALPKILESTASLKQSIKKVKTA